MTPHQPPGGIARRALLEGLVAAGGTAVAGCLGTDDSTRAPATATGSPTGTPTASSTASDTVTPSPSPSRTEASTASPAVTVEVGPDRSLRFEPRSFTVDAGEAVAWVFRSLGHNVKPQSIPAAASWTGTPGGESDTLPEGFVYRYDFTVPGVYEYVCTPHRSAGMVGSFTVEG